MKNWLRTLVLTGIAVMASLVVEDSLPLGKPHGVSANVEPQHVAERLALLQTPFIPNAGQVDQEVGFYARTFCGTFLVTRNGEMVYTLTRGNEEEGIRNAGVGRGNEDKPSQNTTTMVLKERLLNARRITPEGKARTETRVNYFIGNDQSKWKTDLPTYDVVSMDRVYENIDLSLKAYGNKVEKVFTLNPGGNVSDILLSLEGATSLKLTPDGELEVEIPHSELHIPHSEFICFSAPIAFQEINGKRKDVQVAYDVRGVTEYGFRVEEYDPRLPLIIDPRLEHSTYLGGSLEDTGYSMAVDNQGNIFIAGGTSSLNFPTKLPSYQGTYQGGLRDAFVIKLNASGSAVIYSTYFGGNSDDMAQGITVDGSGNAYICGYTTSGDIPILNPYQGANQGAGDGFVTKFNAAGSALLYSTYLGGNGLDTAQAIVVDASGNAYVGGSTSSANFPTSGVGVAYRWVLAGAQDVFVTKLNPVGNTLAYSTYLGGTGTETCASLKIDGSGNAYVCGSTTSADFPTSGTPYQTLYRGGTSDGFVTRFNAAGSALLYSTYLGGTGRDDAYALAIDDSGSIYVGGLTGSGDFPTVNPYQGSHQGGTYDCFIAELAPSGDTLIFSTYFGGDVDDYVVDIAIDQSKNIYVAGYTSSTNLPVKNAIQEGFQGGSSDGFVSKFNPACDSLLWSTYLGGDGSEAPSSMTVEKGDVYLAGQTSSANFPTKNPYQGTYGGGTSDAFVVKISPVVKAKMFYFSPGHNLKE